MKKFFISVEVYLDQIMDSLHELDEEELFNFIVDLERSYQDFNLLERLRNHFNDEFNKEQE